MNTTLRSLTVAIALTAAAAGTAFAQEATFNPNRGAVYTSTVSQAEVRAEAKRALAAGELSEAAFIEGDDDFNSVKTRAEVRMAAQRALKSGETSVHAQEAWRPMSIIG